MTDGLRVRHVRRHVKAAGLAAMLAGTAHLAGCSAMSSLGMGDVASTAAVPDTALDSDGQSSMSELAKATEYWRKQYAKNPADAAAALNYAKNLKAMGQKKEALAVLQQTHPQNSQNREHLSEYGRLALELGQVSTAKQLLERADDPIKPDWRVVSALGTVLAKEGRYKEAIANFERARALAPGKASVLNNLAMAHALDGEAAKAEALLRRAADGEGSDARVRQNLALVLGVQGKYGEAKKVAGIDLSEESAQGNIDYLRKMTRAEPRSGASEPLQPAAMAAAQDAGEPRNPQRITRSAPRPDAPTSRKMTSPVATSSIGPADPEQIISAAMQAEASRRAEAEKAR